jgi:hypothetical protein
MRVLIRVLHLQRKEQVDAQRMLAGLIAGTPPALKDKLMSVFFPADENISPAAKASRALCVSLRAHAVCLRVDAGRGCC